MKIKMVIKIFELTFVTFAMFSLLLMFLAFAITSDLLEDILLFSMGVFTLSGVGSMASRLWEEYTRLD